MISKTTSCGFQSLSQGLHHHHQAYAIASGGVDHDHIGSASDSLGRSSGSDGAAQSTAILYSLSLLKDKVNQVESLVSILISPDQSQTDSTSIAVASMSTLIQEIIVTASSMMLACQQMTTTTTNNSNDSLGQNSCIKLQHARLSHSSMYPETLDWYSDQQDNNYVNVNRSTVATTLTEPTKRDHQALLPQLLGQGGGGNQQQQNSTASSSTNYDIIELDAAELLAKYTHYCQICGKGFKRDANLRMHMRAHGDEYKTSSALSNPLKKINNSSDSGLGSNKEDSKGYDDNSINKLPRKYSCPQEGCRWNQRHAKFQPLKSMICVKNHYKRSHCPKMYVCKQCNRKQFSVLSDLRTHEKHCGDLKWQCSCGTTFSRKDKLMGHVALFIGHSPLINNNSNNPAKGGAKVEHRTSSSMHVDHR